MSVKITKHFIEENRNRKFWAIKANGTLLATYIWSEPVADVLVGALTEYAAKDDGQAIIEAIES